MLNTRLVLWISALLAAAFGTYILYDANPGINWGLWVAATSAGLITTRMAAGKPVRTHTYVLLSWATLLAFAASVTAVDVHAPLIIATVAILLGLAVTTLDDSALGITLPSVVQVPFTAVTRVGKQSGSEFVALPANARGLRGQPGLRGVLLSVPVVLILVALLSKADPILDSVRDVLLGWMDNWVIDGQLVFFVVLALITLGAYGLAAAARDQVAPRLRESEPAFRFGRAETKMLLYSVNAVLWIFVLLQLVALTRNPGATAGTGITFAEYARRGFAELSVAAAFVLGVILVIEVFRKPEPGEKRRLELTAILAIVLILASAFRRVLLYEAAYGYTTDRLIAHVYMIVLAGAFIMLAWDLSRGAVSAAFGRRGMTLTLAAVTAFMYWNYEGWVVRQNLERASQGAELDVKYLNSLSLAAVPALVEGRNSLNPEHRAVLDSALRCRKIPATPAWYERNLRVDAARAALSSFAGQCARK
ncbi:MAG: DUF4173 domain-containing protein [Gemmatimonadaceae bacterium]|nr:DUF4173 domain-containing protein [Gemmatimonadaceae bacterium]